MDNETLYFKFNSISDMFTTIEACRRVEDASWTKRTMFATYSSGDSHECYPSKAENTLESERRLKDCAAVLQIEYSVTTQRNAEAWDSVFARMAGIS